MASSLFSEEATESTPLRSEAASSSSSFASMSTQRCSIISRSRSSPMASARRVASLSCEVSDTDLEGECVSCESSSGGMVGHLRRELARSLERNVGCGTICYFKPSVLMPGLTADQAFHMPCHNGDPCTITFEVENSHHSSFFHEPLLSNCSDVSLCCRSAFQSSLPGASPLTTIFARRALACASGSKILMPPWETGRIAESHATCALHFLSGLPHQIKFRTNAFVFVRMPCEIFAHDAMYQMDANITWFDTSMRAAIDKGFGDHTASLLRIC